MLTPAIGKLRTVLQRSSAPPESRRLAALLNDFLPGRRMKAHRALLMQVAGVGALDELVNHVGETVDGDLITRIVNHVIDAYPTPAGQALWGLQFWAEVFDKKLLCPPGLLALEPGLTDDPEPSRQDESSSAEDVGKQTNSSPNSTFVDHWTQLLPSKHGRLRKLYGRMLEGTKLPYSNNLSAACLQFFWLFAHGMVGAALFVGLSFFLLALSVIWQPSLYPLLLLLFAVSGTFLFLFADLLLFRRVDKQVDIAGGTLGIDSSQLDTWLQAKHQSVIVGYLILVLIIGAGVWRLFEINLIQDQIRSAISSAGTLQADIELFERENNFRLPISSYHRYQPVVNSEAGITVEDEKIVLTLKIPESLKNKKVMLRSEQSQGAISWPFCWSDDIELYLMPENCRSRPY